MATYEIPFLLICASLFAIVFGVVLRILSKDDARGLGIIGLGIVCHLLGWSMTG